MIGMVQVLFALLIIAGKHGQSVNKTGVVGCIYGVSPLILGESFLGFITRTDSFGGVEPENS